MSSKNICWKIWGNETMISEGNNMKIRELLEVLNTDSVVLSRENDMLVDYETPYINQALIEYMDEEIERITPLNNAIEIILK